MIRSCKCLNIIISWWWFSYVSLIFASCVLNWRTSLFVRIKILTRQSCCIFIWLCFRRQHTLLCWYLIITCTITRTTYKMGIHRIYRLLLCCSYPCTYSLSVTTQYILFPLDLPLLLRNLASITSILINWIFLSLRRL